MSELTLAVIKFGYLAVLWLFVISAVSVIRTDLFGAKAGKASRANRGGRNAAAAAPPAPAPGRARRKKGEPTRALVTQGASSGRSAALGDHPITIGRGQECELPIEDEYVSTRHTVLRPYQGAWYAEDLGSTNGTFVGGARIHGPTLIGPGTQVRAGKTVIELAP